jgi:Ca-activated chloride channel homolog
MRNFLFSLLSFLILSSFSTIVFAQVEDDEPIEVDSSMVVVNAAITDASGKAVSGLNQTLFKIFEDGKEQKIDFFAAEKTPFAAIILLDSSGSMEQRISVARAAAIKFLDGLRADDNVAIYDFNSKISLIQDFSNSRDITTERIFDVKADGQTILNDAIVEAAKELEKRPEKRKAIIVLSDGADTVSKNTADKALKAALAADATIYTVDMSVPEKFLSQRPSEKERMAMMASKKALKNFAEKSGGTFIEAAGGDALRKAFQEIVAELGSQYTITYLPENKTKDGKWREIEVRVSKPNLNIRTRKGYNAPKEKGKK